MQWNADGVSTKGFELREKLLKDDIDICLIQESKLRPGDLAQTIKGYAMIRSDRPGRRAAGGGLLTYIRDSIIFEPLGEGNADGTEFQTFRVMLNRSRWMDMANVYVAPSNNTNVEGRTATLDLAVLPAGNRCVIMGDFNAHSQLWDPIQTPDERGDAIADWLVDNDFSLLNDGSTTRHNRATGRGSTPDLTVCGSWWGARSQWRVEEDIGGSDHLPIVTTFTSQIRHQPIQHSAARWKRNNVTGENSKRRLKTRWTT